MLLEFEKAFLILNQIIYLIGPNLFWFEKENFLQKIQ
jgi:hypothetical protein